MKNVERELLSVAGLMLTAIILASSACGVRTPPRPPVDTQARPPEKFAVKIVEDGVHLGWSRPSKSSDGQSLRDLIGFIVERESRDISAFEVIADIPVEDTHRIRPQQNFAFIDSSPPDGTVRYRVRAYAADGQIGQVSPVATLLIESQ